MFEVERVIRRLIVVRLVSRLYVIVLVRSRSVMTPCARSADCMAFPIAKEGRSVHGGLCDYADFFKLNSPPTVGGNLFLDQNFNVFLNPDFYQHFLDFGSHF